MGFDDRLVDWIRACMPLAKCVVLINGEPSLYFHSGRGLRQGDPMSPLIFVLISNILSKMWMRAECHGLIRGFHVAPKTIHLPFIVC